MREQRYIVPRSKQVRVIIDTDAGAEADDQFAIAHALMTPKFDVVGIIAEQFGDRQGESTMLDSYDEIKRVVRKMGLEDEVTVLKGEEKALDLLDNEGVSEGVQFIIDEAFKEDDRPLFVLNMGAITNLATAHRMNPAIDDHIVAIWIGGGTYPVGHMDFNLANDVTAANTIMASNMELWQIPLGSYTRMAVSFYELMEKVAPCGTIGAYLIEKMMAVNEEDCSGNLDDIDFGGKMSRGAKSVFIRTSEGWSLGDSPAVGVLITPQAQNMSMIKGQRFNPDGTYGEYIGDHRLIRVYNNIDSRVILEDFYAKLRYHFS